MAIRQYGYLRLNAGSDFVRIAVCDDMKQDLTALCDYIADYLNRMGYIGEVSAFETAEALLDDLSGGFFDLYFLDIYMPGMSGIDVARKIREMDRDCKLIFITTSADHAMDGYGVQASGYVVKPFDKDRMDKALYTCNELFERAARMIRVPVGKEGHVDVPLTKIRYAETSGRGSRLHLVGSTMETRLKLEEVRELLGGDPFLRCHGSFIVNMNYIDEVMAEDFLMEGGGRVPIRKNGRKKIRLAYAGFLAGGVKR